MMQTFLVGTLFHNGVNPHRKIHKNGHWVEEFLRNFTVMKAISSKTRKDIRHAFRCHTKHAFKSWESCHVPAKC